MSLWASACLSYGPCARAGVYAPMASVRRVVNARVFIRASKVRHVAPPQRPRRVPNHGRKRCTGATGIARAALRAFDIREHLPRSVGVANVHVNPHGAGRDVEAGGTARARSSPADPRPRLRTVYPRIRVLLSRARGPRGPRSERL